VSFWIYLLRCADGSFYAGHTDDLDKRIGEHATGACGGYAATRLPGELVWSQECSTRVEALSFERQIKGWGRAKKEALIRGNWDEISRLAKTRSDKKD